MPKRLSIVRKIILPTLMLVLWYLVTRFGNVHPLILPSLESITRDFISLVQSGELPMHICISLKRCLCGCLLGSFLGVTSGILMGWSRIWADFFDLLINFIRSIPKTALAPLFIVWFGLGDMPKILLIGLSSYFFTVIPTIEGVRNVDNIYIKSARSMGANEWQIMKTK